MQNSSQLQQGLLTNSTSTSTSTSTSQRPSNSWLNYFRAFFFVIVGTFILCALGEPLIKSVVGFADAAKLPSFSVSYLVIPFAMNYGVAVQSITSARQKTQKSISLTLSAVSSFSFQKGGIKYTYTWDASCYYKSLRSSVLCFCSSMVACT